MDVRWHSSVFRDQCRIIGTDGEINLSPLSGPEITIREAVNSFPFTRICIFRASRIS